MNILEINLRNFDESSVPVKEYEISRSQYIKTLKRIKKYVGYDCLACLVNMTEEDLIRMLASQNKRFPLMTLSLVYVVETWICLEEYCMERGLQLSKVMFHTCALYKDEAKEIKERPFNLMITDIHLIHSGLKKLTGIRFKIVQNRTLEKKKGPVDNTVFLN